jgi:hypothetical protein
MMAEAGFYADVIAFAASQNAAERIAAGPRPQDTVGYRVRGRSPTPLVRRGSSLVILSGAA